MQKLKLIKNDAQLMSEATAKRGKDGFYSPDLSLYDYLSFKIIQAYEFNDKDKIKTAKSLGITIKKLNWEFYALDIK